MDQKTALLEPKIFISYSWTTPTYEKWVVDLGTRLMHDGIKVVLDKWDLKEGQDTFAFMESMVNSAEIDKVLILCDGGYKERADGRLGGVGTETQIITPQIYKDVNQEKFIPIVTERNEKGDNFIPTYIATRLYIDLSSKENFEDNYDQLIRNIFQVPLHKKPALGKRPEYLLKNEAEHFQTTTILKKMNASAENNPKRLIHLANDFIDAFITSLDQFKITQIDDIQIIDELIFDKINDTLPLLEDYLAFLKFVIESEKFDADLLIEFFEKLYPFTNHQGSGTFYEVQFDHFKFLLNEIFLYTVSFLLKNKEYTVVTQLLNADYYDLSPYSRDRPMGFNSFRFYLKSLERRNERLKLNRRSIHADLLVQRAKGNKIDLETTDMFLHFITKLNDRDEWGWEWYPTTFFYLLEYDTPIRLISRLKSRSHFESVKQIFNVDTKEELIVKITNFKSDDQGYRGMPNIKRYIKPEEICTIP
ncbi:SEFIR domain-containing protein [Peribacillus muralis]|uniref:SEFIR domain-containing protein n=1 Tax=Peribacillus muralis TaxID=264697 RepID=UPI003D027900